MSRDASERLFSPLHSAGSQYQTARHLERNDVDGADLDRLSPSEQEAVESTVHRGGDDAARAVATDGGGEVWRVHQLDLNVNSDALASNIMRHSDEIDVERVVDDLEALSRADVDGVNELAQRIARGDRSNVKGAAFEAEVAVSRSTGNVEAIGKPNPHSRGEIDIETTDGRVIETKSEDYTQSVTDSQKFVDLENQIGHYQQYTAVEGGAIEVVFRESPHSDIRQMLESSDVTVVTYDG